MAYSFQDELKKVKDYYNGDPLQKRFSALVTGETNAGKTFILRTARFPIHIDSFDPGGSKCLGDLIAKGDIVVDSRWENEDPYNPTAFAAWMKATEIRIKTGYFDHFGTYCLDSLTTFSDAIMNYQMNLKQTAGNVPNWKDYNPQKIIVQNYVRKLMNLKCDFILTAHLDAIDDVIGTRPDGSEIKKTKYRLKATGKAVTALPLLFDELYVMVGKQGPKGPIREMLLDSCGEYIARSRLKQNGKLEAKEQPDIKAILKKVGLSWTDKPKLSTIIEEKCE